MVESPSVLTWSHWPLRKRPYLAILLIVFLLLISSLVYFWLGWGWLSSVLLLAFFFSLRDLLFARSIRIDDDGVMLSHPLTGARHWDWDQLEPLHLHKTALLIHPRGRRACGAPPPPGELLPDLQAWLEWQARQANNPDAE